MSPRTDRGMSIDDSTDDDRFVIEATLIPSNTADSPRSNNSTQRNKSTDGNTFNPSIGTLYKLNKSDVKETAVIPDEFWAMDKSELILDLAADSIDITSVTNESVVLRRKLI
jgi:hypothetical protein